MCGVRLQNQDFRTFEEVSDGIFIAAFTLEMILKMTVRPRSLVQHQSHGLSHETILPHHQRQQDGCSPAQLA